MRARRGAQDPPTFAAAIFEIRNKLELSKWRNDRNDVLRTRKFFTANCADIADGKEVLEPAAAVPDSKANVMLSALE